MKQLHGTGVALVTPFDAAGKVDFSALKKILLHTAKGVDYFVVMGTTGESATLTKDEKKKVLSFVVRNNPKKLPIVYGLGGNNTAAVLDDLQQTELDGVTALLSVSPYYNKPSQEGIARHFETLAQVSPLPIILYNVPGRTSSNLTADTTLRLARNKKIIGIKEASGNLEQCMKISKEKPAGFMLISGDDMLTVPLYAIGGCGVISVLANAYPAIFRKMCAAAEKGQMTQASRELFKLVDINAPMYEEGNPVGLKYLMSVLGLCSANVRLPLVSASEGLQKKIDTIISRGSNGKT